MNDAEFADRFRQQVVDHIAGKLFEKLADWMPLPPGTYTGRNVRLGDYYVRELERIGSEHRQVVRYEVVGTGRVEQMPRSRFDRQARAC